jgi:hypothetical protein
LVHFVAFSGSGEPVIVKSMYHDESRGLIFFYFKPVVVSYRGRAADMVLHIGNLDAEEERAAVRAENTRRWERDQRLKAEKENARWKCAHCAKSYATNQKKRIKAHTPRVMAPD